MSDAYKRGWNDWIGGYNENPYQDRSEDGVEWARGHKSAEERAMEDGSENMEQMA